MEKSISINAVFNVFNKALSVVFPVITIAYVSRVLGAVGIGAVSSAQNLATYFTMFAALGIPSYGVRAISQNKEDKSECSRVFSELLLINSISTLCCFVVYFVALRFLKNTYINRELSIVFSVLILMNLFNVEWVYQGFEEYKYIALRSLFIKALSLGLLFFLVRSEQDIIGYAIILCIGTVGNNFLNIIKVGYFVKFSFIGLNIKRHLAPVMTFFASVIAIEIYSLLDITMLTAMKSSECVGFYTNATKIVKMIANTLTSISAVLMPRLSYYFSIKNYDDIRDTSKKFLSISLLVSVPAFLGIIATADYIVKLFLGPAFSSVVLTIQILAILIVSMPLTGGVFCQLLLTSGAEKKYFMCVVMGSIVNAICNYLLIPSHAQNGAALASVASELIVCFAMIVFSQKIIKISFSIKNIGVIFASALVMFAGTLFIKFILIKCGVNSFISLSIMAVTAVIIYGVGLIVFKNEEALGTIRCINRKKVRNKHQKKQCR